MSSRISILLPVYNGEKYLKAAIESILAQSFSDWELLVLDDGSTDRSLEIAGSFDDPRIRALPNDRNLGVAKTLNRGLEKASGEFIARMDSDDESLPLRLEKQIQFLDNHPKVALLGANAISAETGESTFSVPVRHSEIRCNLLFNCSFLHPTVMWRAKVFREDGLFYEENPTAEDYDLWERACRRVETANLGQCLLRYRNDPEVKVTSYVQQQKEGGRRVRERALRAVGLDPSPEEMETHHATAYDNILQSAISIDRVDAWFNQILEVNGSSGVLDDSALRQRLHLQRYYHIVRNLPAVTPKQVLAARGTLGQVPARLALRAFGKRLLSW